VPRSARGPRAAAQVVLRVQGAPVPRPARGPRAAARPGRPPRSGRSGTTPVPAPRAAPRVVLPVQGAPAPLPFRRHEPRLRSFLAFTALRCLGPFRVRERPSRSSSPFTALRPRSQFRRHEPRLRSFFAFTALRCLGPFRVRERPSRSSSRVQGAPVPRPLPGSRAAAQLFSPFWALRPRSQFRRHEPRLRSFLAFKALRCLGPLGVRERPPRSSSAFRALRCLARSRSSSVRVHVARHDRPLALAALCSCAAVARRSDRFEQCPGSREGVRVGRLHPLQGAGVEAQNPEGARRSRVVARPGRLGFSLERPGVESRVASKVVRRRRVVAPAGPPRLRDRVPDVEPRVTWRCEAVENRRAGPPRLRIECARRSAKAVERHRAARPPRLRARVPGRRSASHVEVRGGGEASRCPATAASGSSAPV